MVTEISSTIVQRRTACSNPSISNFLLPSSPVRNCIRFNDARLQAVSSRNIYSEQGFDARIGPDFGQVCQSLMVVWNWMPGSAQLQAAKPTLSQSSAAFRVLTVSPVVLPFRSQSLPASTAFKKLSVTRTELFEFWPETVE